MSDDTNIAAKLAKMPSVWWARLMELAPRIDVLAKKEAAAELAPLLAQVPGLLPSPDQSAANMGFGKDSDLDPIGGYSALAALFQGPDEGYAMGELEMDAAIEIRKLRDKVEALERFKSYVHSRLDAAGVPTHPEGPHSKEGCRVGDRLDILIGERDQSTATLSRLRALAEEAKAASEKRDSLYAAIEACDEPEFNQLSTDFAGAAYLRVCKVNELIEAILSSTPPPSPRADYVEGFYEESDSSCVVQSPAGSKTAVETNKQHVGLATQQGSGLAHSPEDAGGESGVRSPVSHADLLAKYRADLVAMASEPVCPFSDPSKVDFWSDGFRTALLHATKLLDSTFGAKRDGAGEVGRDTDLPPRGVPTGGWKDYPDCHMIMSSCCFRPDCRRCDEFKRHSSHRFYGLLLALTEYFREGRPYPKHFEWVVEHFDPRKNACAAEETWAKYQSTLERMRKQENEGEE